MNLREAAENLGASVVYRPHPDATVEEGTITNTNDQFVFVWFHGSSGAKATRPEDLEFTTPEVYQWKPKVRRM